MEHVWKIILKKIKIIKSSLQYYNQLLCIVEHGVWAAEFSLLTLCWNSNFGIKTLDELWPAEFANNDQLKFEKNIWRKYK